MKPEDVTSKRYGRLTALRRIGSTKSGNSFWEFKCDCGKSHAANLNDVKNGGIRSCGCLSIEKHKKHGLRSHPLYGRWLSMLRRCYNKNNDEYHNYGGRGIRVCERWHDIGNFIADVGSPGQGQSLDRINVNGDYAPSNVRWANQREQSWNMRKNIFIEYGGKKKCIAEWAKEKNMGYGTLRSRIVNLRWESKRAIETPPDSRFRRKNAVA